ncbi:hypothetical protein ACLX1H_007866 [Fusarium chlamydosporum]
MIVLGQTASAVRVEQKDEFISPAGVLTIGLDIKIPSHHGNPGFTMVDNWDEILDAPANASIVRSKGNWLGRLAAMSLCLQLGRPNIVLPNRFCWECVVDAWRHMKPQHAKQRKQTADLSV